MPAGPPAMKLVAMADVSGVDDEEKMTISKILTASPSVIEQRRVLTQPPAFICNLTFNGSHCCWRPVCLSSCDVKSVAISTWSHKVDICPSV